MANLQAALDEAQTEVDNLQKQQIELARDNKSLIAKKVFLLDAIKKLQKEQVVGQALYEGKINKAIEDLEAIELSVDERKIDYKLLLDKIEVAKTNLQSLQEAADTAIAEQEAKLKVKKQEIATIAELLQQTLNQLEENNRQIIIQENKLVELEETVKKAQVDTDTKIVQIKQKTKEVQAKLTAINHKLDDKAEEYFKLEAAVAQKSTQLAEVAKKHADYLEYEKRADKALRARETALLEGEANLATAKRRNPSSVLDNL